MPAIIDVTLLLTFVLSVEFWEENKNIKTAVNIAHIKDILRSLQILFIFKLYLQKLSLKTVVIYYTTNIAVVKKYFVKTLKRLSALKMIE